MEGILYAFNTICDPNIYKVGYTRQTELAARLRGYLGPSKPRVIVVSRRVDDATEAERLLLGLLRVSNVVRARPDLGDEWFEALGAPDHTQRTIHWISGIVERAVRVPCRTAAPDPPSQAPALGGDDLRGMESYFAAMDGWWGTNGSNDDVTSAVQAFEESAACPVYAHFTRFSLDERVAAARARFVA